MVIHYEEALYQVYVALPLLLLHDGAAYTFQGAQFNCLKPQFQYETASASGVSKIKQRMRPIESHFDICELWHLIELLPVNGAIK